ncbi:unnamed protein product [Ectocarpus sp. 12 AP-2014]
MMPGMAPCVSTSQFSSLLFRHSPHRPLPVPELLLFFLPIVCQSRPKATHPPSCVRDKKSAHRCYSIVTDWLEIVKLPSRMWYTSVRRNSFQYIYVFFFATAVCHTATP